MTRYAAIGAFQAWYSGNAGCVLARRLSESGKYTVFLIKKGDVMDSDLGLGGTTCINGGQYTLGVPAEYNAWSEEGRPGWSYDDLKLTSLNRRPGSVPPQISGTELAYRLGQDAIYYRRRWLPPVFLPFVFAPNFVTFAANLHICTRAIASKLAFLRQTDGRLLADSVEVQSIDRRALLVIKARREIVLTCGAFGTPKVLLLRFRARFDFYSTLFRHLRYSQAASDQKSISKTWEYKPSDTPLELARAWFNAELHGPEIDRWKGLFGQNIALMKAESRGRVLLRSRDPTENPLCDMGYLTHPKDWAALRAVLRVSVYLGRQMSANGYPLDEAIVPSALDDDTFNAYMKERVETMYHYTSSCRMASEVDPLPGVLDPELRVHGSVSDPQIAGVSILPSAPAVHPQALVYAVAEKCADMMLND
ncbi:GMC oxidoreductase-domain-containing protein [Mycena albidolilacea]|uniref:GMC oxidoreductase-domain-containing protein n=1 Tax=Mycena albidolilacea TaxID=1033008 RepID=A0AAD7EYD1_9AGAR|nr:GMC oxidoreductase-domain-containing protein [Mycena albidolilacea]